jgi:hypothetical protein
LTRRSFALLGDLSVEQLTTIAGAVSSGRAVGSFPQKKFGDRANRGKHADALLHHSDR